MFQIISFSEARLAAVANRIEKHGDNDVPAVLIGLELTTANTILDSIDPTLRLALYKPRDDQDDLPGIEQSTPVLRCNSIERVVLSTKHEGWTLRIDDGVDDTAPMVFGKAKIDKLSVEPKQGGTIILRFRVGTSDIDAARSGFLAMHVGQSVWITLTAPEKPEDVIDGSTEAFERDHPGESDMFDDDGVGVLVYPPYTPNDAPLTPESALINSEG